MRRPIGTSAEVVPDRTVTRGPVLPTHTGSSSTTGRDFVLTPRNHAASLPLIANATKRAFATVAPRPARSGSTDVR